MNRTLDMILRNLKVEMARIDKENKELKESNHHKDQLITKLFNKYNIKEGDRIDDNPS